MKSGYHVESLFFFFFSFPDSRSERIIPHNGREYTYARIYTHMEKFTYEASWLPAASLRSTGKKNTDCSEVIISQETRPTKREPARLPNRTPRYMPTTIFLSFVLPLPPPLPLPNLISATSRVSFARLFLSANKIRVQSGASTSTAVKQWRDFEKKKRRIPCSRLDSSFRERRTDISFIRTDPFLLSSFRFLSFFRRTKSVDTKPSGTKVKARSIVRSIDGRTEVSSRKKLRRGSYSEEWGGRGIARKPIYPQRKAG